MEYEDYTVAQQDLANVHFRFEEEEEYITAEYSMEEENPFHTPTQQSFMDGIKDYSYCSPHHSISPTGTQHKLKRSFGMENISPLYFYNKPNL